MGTHPARGRGDAFPSGRTVNRQKRRSFRMTGAALGEHLPVRGESLDLVWNDGAEECEQVKSVKKLLRDNRVM